MDVVASKESAQLWDRSKIVLIGLLASTVVKYMNIHNEVIFIFTSLLFLGLFLYVKAAAATLPYPGLAVLLTKIADFTIMVAGFFTATIVTNMTTTFLSTDGAITLRTSNKLIIFLLLAIALYIILPKYLLINDMDKRIDELVLSTRRVVL